MAPVRNARYFRKTSATWPPVLGQTLDYDDTPTIDLENAPLNGGFLLKHLVVGIEPYLMSLIMMNVIQVDQPLQYYGISVVVRSDNPRFKSGQHLYGMITFEEYSIRSDADNFKPIDDLPKLPWSAYIGVAGMPGQTAFYGYKEFYAPKKGDVMYVSGAAGPVGNVAVQLAKADGLKVIASAGSDEKVKFLKEMGADVAFNYKVSSVEETLQKEGPINVYWDNVGGATLDAALACAAEGATFIECGMIDAMPGTHTFKNMLNIVTRRLKLVGFVIIDLHEKYEAEFYRKIPALVADGKIKYSEDVRTGLQHVGQAILDMKSGNNAGKVAISIADD